MRTAGCRPRTWSTVPVGRRVVNEHRFQADTLLRGYGIETRVQMAPAVPRHDDHGNIRDAHERRTL